jgi:hypothetical protein
VQIINAGTTLLFLLRTAEARKWGEAHVSAEWKSLATGFAVEPRYAAALVARHDPTTAWRSKATVHAAGTGECGRRGYRIGEHNGDRVEAVITTGARRWQLTEYVDHGVSWRQGGPARAEPAAEGREEATDRPPGRLTVGPARAQFAAPRVPARGTVSTQCGVRQPVTSSRF